MNNQEAVIIESLINIRLLGLCIQFLSHW